MWVTPKTDWAPSDTMDIIQDMGRISGDTQYLKDAVTAAGYRVPLDDYAPIYPDIKTSWAYTDMLVDQRVDTIICTIYAMYDCFDASPPVPDRIYAAVTAGYFNAIEESLVLLKEIVDSISTLSVHCGSIQCGQQWPI